MNTITDIVIIQSRLTMLSLGKRFGKSVMPSIPSPTNYIAKIKFDTVYKYASFYNAGAGFNISSQYISMSVFMMENFVSIKFVAFKYLLFIMLE